MIFSKFIAAMRDLTIVIGSLGFITFASFSLLSNERGPAVIISDIRFEQSIIPYGNALTVISKNNVLRTCNVSVHRIIVDAATKKVVVREERPSASNQPGSHEVRIVIELPRELMPGEYKYRAVLYPECQGTAAPVLFTPELNFFIVPVLN